MSDSASTIEQTRSYGGDLFTPLQAWRISHFNAKRLRLSCKWCGVRYAGAIAKQICPSKKS
mgnify:CR=1 FL=1